MPKTINESDIPPMTPFTPAGLDTPEKAEKRLGLATLGYQQSLAYLIDALEEDAPVSVLNLTAQQDAWDAYYTATTEYMRMTIALANAKRRAKNKG
jgi:hypothetical protein